MRSDARLDFVAKSIALAGLGVLGALGAVIDHWPTQAPIPAIERVARSVDPEPADIVATESVPVSRTVFDRSAALLTAAPASNPRTETRPAESQVSAVAPTQETDAVASQSIAPIGFDPAELPDVSFSTPPPVTAVAAAQVQA